MSIYREYDIRGVVGKDLTGDVAERIGLAFATLGKRRGLETIALGRDGRTSSPMLHERLIAGLTRGGLDIVDIGVCPTPLLYFAVYTFSVDGGVMITGSHNAGEYNGFKLCIGREAIHGQDIQDLRAIVEGGRFASGAGTVSDRPVIPAYLDMIRERFGAVDASRLHVVTDCGNGAAALVARSALEQMGCRVTELYGELDGRFPNHHPDPTVVENLQDLIAKVREVGADVGFGYDGDADRIGAVDERGDILWGDRLMVIYARDILASRPGSTIISEVKASQTLYDEIRRCGGRPVMWKAGHSLIKAKLKEEQAVLAGEMSGHMFFADRYYGFDDAIYASCRLVEILAKRGAPLSTLLSDLPRTEVTPEIRVECDDEEKFEVVRRVQDKVASYGQGAPGGPGGGLRIRDLVTIDGLRIVFDDGWGLIRASNTQPAIVLRFEAPTRERLRLIQTFVENELRAAQAASAA